MSVSSSLHLTSAIALLLLAGCAEPAPTATAEGRWDMTVTEDDQVYPMWLELSAMGGQMAGRIQGRTGHALPTGLPAIEDGRVTLDLPAEWDPAGPRRLDATVHGDSLSGMLTRDDGSSIPFNAVRAPSLERTGTPEWGDEIDLLASGMTGWQVRIEGRDGWSLENGELTNQPPSSDLITMSEFTDFKLHVEVNVPEAGNSGIYLRGRYEVQVQDDYGNEPNSRGMGGIYGQVTPTVQPALPPGEWQSFDITLVGRQVTVVLNGVTMIDNAEIPGITGGALDSDEGQPGPIMLQGDHSGIRYRNILITPARN